MWDDFESDELADCDSYSEWCLLRDESRIASQEADLWDQEDSRFFPFEGPVRG